MTTSTHDVGQPQGAAPPRKGRLGGAGRDGQGQVIILASLSGKRVKSAGAGSYSLSKFAAVALAHAIRQTGFDQGIRATPRPSAPASSRPTWPRR